MKKTLYILFCITLLLYSVPVSAFDLTILHTNDVHSALGGAQKSGMPCYAPACEGGQGGALRLKQAVDTARAGQGHVLLLDAGDQAQGTLFYTLFKGEPLADVMNLLRYDAMVPGNHEFDDGCPGFAKFAERLNVPLVAANLHYERGFSPVPEYKPWRIVERGGRKIGIVGLITPRTPATSRPCAGVSFGEPAAALKKAVSELRAAGVNIVIALTHLGIDVEKQLASSVEGVDIIVGGHSHTYLSNSRPKKAEGPYPVVQHSPAGNPVLVVTCRNGLLEMGKLHVKFDAEGRPVSWQGDAEELKDGSPELAAAPDRKLEKLIDGYSEKLRVLLAEKLGILSAALPEGQTLLDPDIKTCRRRECFSGDILADCFLWAGRAEKADFALVNGGSVRSSLHTGELTAGDLLTVMPFDNTLVTGKLTGKTVRTALEQGLGAYQKHGGSFPQVAGLRYSADVSKPAGNRLVSVEYRAADGSWLPLRDEATYTMATTDFLAEGRDGYSVLKSVQWQYSGRGQAALFREYVRTNSPLVLSGERRITVLGE